jgi:hypothetical protein
MRDLMSARLVIEGAIAALVIWIVVSATLSALAGMQ